MKIYTIKIKAETTKEGTILIKAKDIEQALDIAKKKYLSGEFELDPLSENKGDD